MVFCNMEEEPEVEVKYCHNPYFNRWFSAILLIMKEAYPKNSSQSLF